MEEEKYQKVKDVIERKIKGKGILLIKGEEQYFVERIGMIVWNLLNKDKGKNKKEIISALLKVLKNPPPTNVIKRDVDEFLESLKEAKLITSIKENKHGNRN